MRRLLFNDTTYHRKQKKPGVRRRVIKLLSFRRSGLSAYSLLTASQSQLPGKRSIIVFSPASFEGAHEEKFFFVYAYHFLNHPFKPPQHLGFPECWGKSFSSVSVLPHDRLPCAPWRFSLPAPLTALFGRHDCAGSLRLSRRCPAVAVHSVGEKTGSLLGPLDFLNPPTT